ncbi:hypothetical protein VTO73DRAFT_8613 [Trametes versicolor]
MRSEAGTLGGSRHSSFVSGGGRILMLYGVTCLQTFTYYRSPKAKTDTWLLWSLVAALLVFDSAHQAVVIHAVYNYLVLDFANPFKVVTLVWSVPAILALILNGFLTFRLWKLSTQYYLTGIAGALTLANFGTNLAYAIRGYQYDNIFAAETVLRHQGIAGLSISVATESMISFTLAYYLHNRRTGLRKSNDIITKLIALTVTTGMLTTLFNVADLIAYVTAHNNLYVLFFNFMLGKLIAARSIRKLSLDIVRPPHPITFDRSITANHLAFVAVLLRRMNSRDYVLGMMGDGQGTSDHETLKLPPSSAGSGHSGASNRPRVASPHAAVHIAMDRFVVSDTHESEATKYERGAASRGANSTL